MYFNIIIRYTAVIFRGWLRFCRQLEASLCLLKGRVNGTLYSSSSIESTTQPVNSTQGCIGTRSLRFKCPILFWHANVTPGAFLLTFLTAHITNTCHFPWVNIPCESYCRVAGHLASILKDLGSDLCQNTWYFAEFFFYFLQMLSSTFFLNSKFKSFYHFMSHKNCC